MIDPDDYRLVRRGAEFVDERSSDLPVTMADRREFDADGLLHSSFQSCSPHYIENRHEDL